MLPNNCDGNRYHFQSWNLPVHIFRLCICIVMLKQHVPHMIEWHVVVVYLPRPMESLEQFNVLKKIIYHSEHYGLIVGP